MLLTDFRYQLPTELIAQEPLADRASSRMLHLVRTRGFANGKLVLNDRQFRDLPDLLRPDDLLVFNNTRVFPARLYGCRSGSKAQPVSPRIPAAKEFLKGQVEVLLTKRVGDSTWQALVRPGRKIGVGETLSFHGADGLAELQAEVLARGEFGERTLRFDLHALSEDFFSIIERIGHVPLPPYIDRPDELTDREHYQTVFSTQLGSVAAPTAGLHFTPEILARISKRGIEAAEITLHIGLGTFQPLHHEHVEENKLHTEQFSISSQAAEQINRAKSSGRRVIAVGTTTVRTLEFAGRNSRFGEGEIISGSGEVDIFIYPGFKFRVVDALLSNFHLPQSSLLMLVCAFAGREPVLHAYEHAVQEKYRFFSYGDCMFIE